MKLEIKVPAMGESISEATIGPILKKPGTQVNMDDELLELETDKVNQVLYAPQAGVFSLTGKEGDVVKIGEVVGFIETTGAVGEKTKSEQETSKPSSAQKKDVSPQKNETPKPVKNEGKEETKPISKEKIPQQPAEQGARITAEEFLADIFSEEKSKSVQQVAAPEEKKVQAAQQNKVVAEGRETRRKISKIRKVIAQRLVEVQHTTAMLTTFNEVDLTQVIALREKYKDSFTKEHGVKLGFMSFFVKACVSALTAVPDINSYIDGDDIVHREYYDIGIAVGTERGLIVPVVRDCDKLDFPGIEKAIENYGKKGRDGTISADDLQGGGFTITNGGIYGSLLSTPILNPPQCAILGMHKIMKRPVVVDDQIVIRQMMYLALSYDHRIVDGKQAVTFLVHVKNCLEDPARLLLNL